MPFIRRPHSPSSTYLTYHRYNSYGPSTNKATCHRSCATNNTPPNRLLNASRTGQWQRRFNTMPNSPQILQSNDIGRQEIEVDSNRNPDLSSDEEWNVVYSSIHMMLNCSQYCCISLNIACLFMLAMG